MQSLMNVHFSSAALARKLTDRPAMLYFAYNAQVIAVIVAHDLNTGEFVAQVFPFTAPPVTVDSEGRSYRFLQSTSNGVKIALRCSVAVGT
jgi:hypothetical protein